MVKKKVNKDNKGEQFGYLTTIQSQPSTNTQLQLVSATNTPPLQCFLFITAIRFGFLLCLAQ